jgi:hypothetical protein
MSVSADKLGAPAMRPAWLLDRYRAAGSPQGEIDRAGDRGPVVEVYSAAALAIWELDCRGYKSGKKADVKRKEIWRGLSSRAHLKGDQPSNDHQLDAVIS